MAQVSQLGNMDEEEVEKSVFSLSFELLTALEEVKDDKNRHRIMQEHISNIIKAEFPPVTDFPADSEWLTSEPLSLYGNLRDRVVVLDFFTYCCINCMHILPDLHQLEQTYSPQDGVVVVGVHSAKFDNEKLSSNILSAAQRYDIRHPVINDSNAAMWQEMSINCWPTLVIVGPGGTPLLHLVGEGHRDTLIAFVGAAVEYYSSLGQLGLGDVVKMKEPGELRLEDNQLYFPGKVSVRGDGQRLVISDTGRHRLIVTTQDGVILETIGGVAAGNEDGELSSARLRSPQGACWAADDILYVADTDNHTVRQIDLTRRGVSTVAGTGQQGTDHDGGNPGTQQPISSPWDVAMGYSPGSTTENVVLIAMAGTHQIWAYFTKDAKWLKGKQYAAGTCVRFAGNGNEENRNNSYPHNAAFAQPSGITVQRSETESFLYVADSESSSVRSISLKTGAVKNVAGGDRDPKNLFAYGDADGVGVDARLQHPLGVAMRTNDDGQTTLLVADSYNHKIKEIDLKTRACKTVLEGGAAGGSVENQQLNEPGGVSVFGHLVYIADTNNHCIKVWDTRQNTVRKLSISTPVEEPDASLPPMPTKRITPPSAPVLTLPPIRMVPGGTCDLQLALELAPGLALTEGAPSACQICTDDPQSGALLSSIHQTKQPITDLESLPHFTITAPAAMEISDTKNSSSGISTSPENKTTSSGENTSEEKKSSAIVESSSAADYIVEVECMLYYCDVAGVCLMKGVCFRQPVTVTAGDRTDGCHGEAVKLEYRFTSS